jgi:hypothetical protein
MARVLITDQNYEDLALERELFGNAGMELAVAQCETEDEVLAAGRNFDAFLVQYAPIGARALQLPRLVISRIGAGYSTVPRPARNTVCGLQLMIRRRRVARMPGAGARADPQRRRL